MALTSTITDRWAAALGLGYVAGDPKVVFVLELIPKNLTTDALQTIYFSDYGHTTDPSDTPANQLIESRILVVPNITNTLVQRGGGSDKDAGKTLPGLRNFARPEVSEAKIINADTDPDTGAGPLDGYLDQSLWSFSGRQAKLKVGATDLAYTAYETFTELTIKGEPSWDAKGNLTFRFEAPMKRYDEPFNRNTYGGWGAALILNPVSTTVTWDNDWNIGLQDTTLEWLISWDNLAATQRWFQKRATLTGSTDIGWSLSVNSSDQLVFSASDGTSGGTINMGAAGTYGDETRRLFSVVVDWDADADTPAPTIEAFVTVKDSDGEASVTSLGTMDISGWGSIHNALDLTMSKTPDFVDGTAASFRIWRKARSAVEIADTGLHEVSGNESYLVGNYRFNDRKVVTAYQEVTTVGIDSLEFAGGTHKVAYGVNYEKTSSDDFAIGVWFKCNDTPGGNEFIFGNRDGITATDAGYQIHINSSGDVVASICDGSTAKTATTTTGKYGDGTWHFAALRVDRTAKTLEVLVLNTRSDSTFETVSTDITSHGHLTSSNVLTAGQAADGSNAFAGRYGRHFNVNSAATNAEILAMARFPYDTDNISHPPESVSAKNASSSYWNVDEGTGLTVADAWNSIDGGITAAGWVTQDGVIGGALAFESTYEGDVGIGRQADDALQGTPKPQCWGEVHSMPLELVDVDVGDGTSEPIYQAGDPEWGGFKSFDDVFDQGLALALGAAPNDYTVDLVNNAVTLTSAADKDGFITANVKGYVDGSGVLIDNVPDIASAIFTDLGETSQNAASFTALKALFWYRVGLGITAEPHLGWEVMEALFRSSCWCFKNSSGEMQVGLYASQDGVAADLELTAASIAENGITPLIDIPAYTNVEVLYRKNVVTLDSFLAAVQPPEQDRQRRQFRKVNSPASGVKGDHAKATTLTVASLIHRKADAQTEADRLKAIYSVPRKIIRVRIVADLFKAEIGSVVKLTHPRYGYSAGKNWLCVGTSYPKNPSLDLFGPFTAA